MRRIILLIGLFIGLATMQAQIVNEGDLKIEPGTVVYFGDNYTNKTGATHDNDGDLHIEGNFTNDGTGIVRSTSVVTTEGTTYFDSSTNTTQVLGGTAAAAQFNNVVVNNTSGVILGLEVSDSYNLEVTNGVTLTSGKMRLMGEAQLVQTHAGTTANSGTEHIVLDQQGAANSYRYNYWSSPVQNDASIDYRLPNVLKDGTTANQWSPAQVGFTAALNGTNGSPIELSTRWLWKYINGNVDPWNDTGWIQLFDMGTTIASAGADMLPGEGFTMKGTDPTAAYADEQNYSFEGKPNDGYYELTIDADREYLVGNPYPSALDADQFINDNSTVINGTIYYWHHWSTDTHNYTFYGGGFATYTLSAGLQATLHPHFTCCGPNLPVGQEIIPQQYMPVGQGFIVRSTTPGGAGQIKFNNSQRAFMLEGASSVPVKSTNNVTSRIRLGYEGPDNRHRYLVHAFTNNNATDNFDYGYDGQMIDQGDNDLYFSISDENSVSFPYVIQGVGAYDVNARYPLVLKAGTPGEHVIMIDDLEDFEEPLYILDGKGNTHDLRKNPFVAYINEENTTITYYLVFKPTSALSDFQNNLNDFLTVYYANEEIVIINDNDVKLTGLQIYNSIGQLVYQITNPSQLAGDRVRLAFRNFAQSAYFLKVQAQTGTGSYKFINY